MKKLLSILVLLWAGNALAGDAIYTGFFNNNALSGYDTVAYFSQGKPVKGNKQYSTVYKKAKWLFSTSENLQKFEENPAKYAPQYGGFCAWAVAAKNDRASGDPKNWNIVKGKLYLNYDSEIQNKWQKDIAGFIQQADKNWPALLNR
jgi:YHS domain-containing protein